jgi:transposase
MSMGTRSELQRREAVARWRRSGLSAAEFAESLGVSVHTLYAWSARARRESPELVELVAAPPDMRPRVAVGSGPDEVIEIALRNGRVLRAPLSVDDDRLGRLISLAESA